MHIMMVMTELMDIAQNCVLQTVRSAARRVTQAYEAALAPVDLTASQFSTLTAVVLREGLTLGVLAERLAMDRTTMTRVLRPMERRGLIESRRSKEDARATGVYPTKAGKDLLEEAKPLWREMQTRMLSQIGDPGWPTVKDALQRLKT